MNMKALCECDSFNCNKIIILSLEENREAHREGKLIIIDGCNKGPNPTDVFIEKKDGYTIYRETLSISRKVNDEN